MMTDVAVLLPNNHTSCLRNKADQGNRDHTDHDIIELCYTRTIGTIRRRREGAYWTA